MPALAARVRSSAFLSGSSWIMTLCTMPFSLSPSNGDSPSCTSRSPITFFSLPLPFATSRRPPLRAPPLPLSVTPALAKLRAQRDHHLRLLNALANVLGGAREPRGGTFNWGGGVSAAGRSRGCGHPSRIMFWIVYAMYINSVAQYMFLVLIFAAS
ncbi:hypothetical protein B0H19DRAFT_188352 [Mycena capillaripes]|nr:hypothetical protein B0H19DRAFT_537603 [Mycena capillaripes]KAJ6548347.1 hypothetical protein B0H19DRAFT_188352 [Mycena capillaripes]